MRDDIIRGGQQILPALYEGSKDSLAEVLAEKSQAVERAGRMRATFERARAVIIAARGGRVYNEARNSWDHYRNEIGKLKGIASLYRSLTSKRESDSAGAMEATLEQALASLAEGSR
jgi:hypothetical protein